MASGKETDSGILQGIGPQWMRETLYKHRVAYLFVAPIVAYLILLVWFPWFQGLYMSFHEWPLFGDKKFIGLDNYIELVTWPVFWISFRATMIYLTQTIGHVVLGTAMALVVWKVSRKTLAAIFSIVFLIPYVVPPLVTGTIMRFVLSPDVGPLHRAAVELGILAEPIYWTTNADLAITVVTLIGVYTWVPLVFLLVLASLESIPKSYYELADIYGASLWKRFRYITFPQIKTVLLIAVILRIIYNLGKVSQPLVILRGGPNWATSIFGILLYRIAWVRQEFGLAFAVGVILAMLALVFIAVFVWKFEQEQGEVQAL